MQSENNSEQSHMAGLRVLELGTGVAAPYAGRLLSMLGATVVKMEPAQGDPARHQPIDDEPFDGISPLFLSLNTGKRNVTNSPARLAAAMDWADVVLDSRVRNEVADIPELRPAFAASRGARALVYVAVTAWGFEQDDAGVIDDELLVQAVAGVTTLTGDVGMSPLRLPGFQSQYLCGAYAAAATMTALADSPATHLLDIAWVSAMATGSEGSYQRYLTLHALPPPAGSHPLAAFPAGAFRCADGYVVPGTVRFHDWQMQCVLYGMPELLEDERFATPAGRAANYRELWDAIQPWYDARPRAEICDQALAAGWALGMVLGAGDALDDPHLQERKFLRRFSGPDGRSFAAPGRLARGLEAPWEVEGTQPPGADDAWFDACLAVRS